MHYCNNYTALFLNLPKILSQAAVFLEGFLEPLTFALGPARISTQPTSNKSKSLPKTGDTTEGTYRYWSTVGELPLRLKHQET